jgi:DNA segregation ATPase FtsK/SpoIIIE, S-DNA-T family
VNNLIGTKDLLAQLDALKAAVQDFAAREEKLNSLFHAQSAKEKILFDTANNELISNSTRQLAEEADAFKLAKEQLQMWNARRNARINRAQNRVRAQLAARIDAQENATKSGAQQALITAEKQREENLASAVAAFENFQQRLANDTASFLEFEKKVRSAAGGVGGFRRELDALVAVEINPADVGNEMLDEVQLLVEKISAELKKHKSGIISAVVCAIPAPSAKTIAADFVRAKSLIAIAPEQSANWLQTEHSRIETEFQDAKNAINTGWKHATREIAEMRNQRPVELESRITKLQKRNEIFFYSENLRRQQQHESNTTTLREKSLKQAQALSASHKEKLARLEADFEIGWRELENDWKQNALPLLEKIQIASSAAENNFPDWSTLNPNAWQPPRQFLDAAKFARLEIETQKFFASLPKDKRLAVPCPQNFSLPLLLAHPQQGSLLIETDKFGDGDALAAMNNLILRLLATAPPGRVEFTIFDPVGLGQNFATLMHLADYEAGAAGSRIWTQTAQFEEKLAELNERMEKIIQMYLRNEYATIAEYNAQAGSTAEKYHVLVVASFPVNFSDVAARRLRNIAASGARCGVFTLVHWDHRNAPPQEFVPDELRKNSVCLVRGENSFEIANWRPAGVKLILDAPPSAEFATEFLHRVGDLGKNANRVEVPFESVAPSDAEMWSEETREVLRVPIGRSGATKFQYLEIGKGTRQHALIAGKTGSGKSTLFHVIITNLALRCSPEEVEFYLVDFKKGVEFKCYGNRRLPHARVVAVESDREFGLSVLQRVDDELRRRGDLFRKVGAQDLSGYKRNGGTEIVPRTLLMIDEFQEFFTEEDRVSQGAAVLLDRIVRQGRAFGIHVILGSQTLGGAYTLARATIGQMVIRIALQCNEADAYLIMDQDNPAPRLLSRPGEGIYNDAAGAIEGNAPFQAVWLSDKTRDDYLAKIRACADVKNYPGPIVFEGNAPADVRENLLLQSVLEKPSSEIPTPPRVWLGAPNSIKGPTEVVFQRQSGSNLLIVGQSEERTATILSVSLVALAAQFPKNTAKFFVLDGTPPGLPQREVLEQIFKSIPQEIIQGNNGNVAELMTSLAETLKQRAENETSGAEIFVLVQGLQNLKKLRQEDEFSFSSGGDAPNPAAIFTNLITEGPARGIHIIAACDTFNNVGRFVGRKTLAEFEARVLFQMSAADSASLIDAPNASTLGLHRAILFNERESLLETFRPYAPPNSGWLEDVVKILKAK